MTSERTQAYGRVVRTLDDVGATKLHKDEQIAIREFADTLIFAETADEARETVRATPRRSASASSPAAAGPRSAPPSWCATSWPAGRSPRSAEWRRSPARPGMTGRTMAAHRVLLLGAGDLTDETAEALTAADADVRRIEEPDVESLRAALEDGADAVAVVSRDDAWPLRAALLVRHLDADVPIVATIFDPVAGRELEQELGNCTITSLADIVAPTLAGPCLDDDLAAVLDGDDGPIGVRCADGDVEVVPLPAVRARRARSLATAVLQPFDRSAGLVFFGAIGLALHPRRRDAGGGDRARPVAGRRVLRRGQDARHRRPQPGGPGRAEVVQGRDLGLDDRRARVRRGVHRRARRTARRAQSHRAARAAAPSRARTT